MKRCIFPFFTNELTKMSYRHFQVETETYTMPLAISDKYEMKKSSKPLRQVQSKHKNVPPVFVKNYFFFRGCFLFQFVISNGSNKELNRNFKSYPQLLNRIMNNIIIIDNNSHSSCRSLHFCSICTFLVLSVTAFVFSL